MTNFSSLATLGWQPFFQQQLSLEEWDAMIPARVIEQHKSLITVATETASIDLPIQSSMPPMVVGDWILLDQNHRFARCLDRKTCFKRKAAGTKVSWQFIAANVDTAFIVCSMNEDFNLNRIERFLSLVYDADVEPVVLLSKSDLTHQREDFLSQVQRLDHQLFVEAVNCLDASTPEKLSPWIKAGNTMVVLGSSGVGKSTLINTLLGENKQNTSGIREDDDKGRHTTTRRSLLPIPSGGLILDTPGMRELQLADCQAGISSTFSDIEELASRCRYSNCQHKGEPGCAVLRAVESGEIDQRRLDNYLKLLKEEALNSSTLAKKRAKDKALGQFYKRTMKESQKFKGR